MCAEPFNSFNFFLILYHISWIFVINQVSCVSSSGLGNYSLQSIDFKKACQSIIINWFLRQTKVAIIGINQQTGNNGLSNKKTLLTSKNKQFIISSPVKLPYLSRYPKISYWRLGTIAVRGIQGSGFDGGHSKRSQQN